MWILHQKFPGNHDSLYMLDGRGRTTGLSTLPANINAYNQFGMTPVQVASQAGAIDELAHILSHPECEPGKPSRTGHQAHFYLGMYGQSEKGLAAQDLVTTMSSILEQAMQRRFVNVAPPAIPPSAHYVA